MVQRVWKWQELPAFLKEFDLTVNGFAEMIGLRQSTLRNVYTGYTKQPRDHVISAIEDGMRRIRRCECCDTVLMEKPDAKPAGKAKEKARKT
jgi:predicted transcriptional regulator